MISRWLYRGWYHRWNPSQSRWTGDSGQWQSVIRCSGGGGQLLSQYSVYPGVGWHSSKVFVRDSQQQIAVFIWTTTWQGAIWFHKLQSIRLGYVDDIVANQFDLICSTHYTSVSTGIFYSLPNLLSSSPFVIFLAGPCSKSFHSMNAAPYAAQRHHDKSDPKRVSQCTTVYITQIVNRFRRYNATPSCGTCLDHVFRVDTLEFKAVINFVSMALRTLFPALINIDSLSDW